MSVNGISGFSDSTNYFSNMLATKNSGSNKSSSSDALSSMFSSGAASIGDYALIQSGAYKKLLNAYYTKQNQETSDAEVKTEKVNLTSAGQDASNLSKAVSSLRDIAVTEDNRDELKSQLKNVVEKYNSLITSSSDVDNVAVLRQALWMTQGTSAVAASLSDVGLGIGEGNKLTFDEAKFDKAGLHAIKTVVEGRESYAAKLQNRADLLSKAANNAVTGASASSTYRSNGDYTKVNSGNIIDSMK